MRMINGIRSFNVVTAAKKITRCMPKRFSASASTEMKADDYPKIGRPEDIPGPRSLPLIGTLYKYVPYFGSYSFDRYRDMAFLKHRQYGNIIREEILPGVFHYHIYNPEDFETLFRNAGRYPERPSPHALRKYREERGLSHGLAELEGEEWYKLRLAVQQPMMKYSSVQPYIPKQAPVADDLVRNIRHLRDPNSGEVNEFLKEIYKWSLDTMAVIIFGKGLGCMDLNLPPDSLPLQFVETVGTYTEALHKTFLLWPLHKSGKTKAWKQLVRDLDFLYEVFEKYSTECLERCKQQDEAALNSILKSFMENGKMTPGEVQTSVGDLFFGSVETTSGVLGANLYNLAKNPAVQERLYEEIEKQIPRGTPVSPTSFNNMPYLKAVIKETFRLTPALSFLARVIPQEVVLCGYRIPKGSLVFAQTGVASLNEDIFESPYEFKPQRWLRDEGAIKTNPFIIVPFGHGPRTCVGKRFAEQKLYLGLSAIIRNFKLEYHHEDIGLKTKLLNQLDKPLRFKFIDRT